MTAHRTFEGPANFMAGDFRNQNILSVTVRQSLPEKGISWQAVSWYLGRNTNYQEVNYDTAES
jgi:hypothetical protein